MQGEAFFQSLEKANKIVQKSSFFEVLPQSLLLLKFCSCYVPATFNSLSLPNKCSCCYFVLRFTFRYKSQFLYLLESRKDKPIIPESHEKKLSGNSVTSFVYVMFLPWLVPSLFARGQNLAGSFNNISLNIKFWKKYNSKQLRLCFKIFQGVPEWSKLLYFSLLML